MGVLNDFEIFMNTLISRGFGRLLFEFMQVKSCVEGAAPNGTSAQGSANVKLPGFWEIWLRRLGVGEKSKLSDDLTGGKFPVGCQPY